MTAQVIDVDGHILEPATLWSDNIAPEFKSRALRIEIDEEGLEFWSFDGRAVSTYSKGRSANVAAIGTTREWRKEHVFDKRDITWEQALARVPGAWDPDERVKMMTAEGIDMSILYPTLALAFARMEDAHLSAAYCSVYNDWIVDFCSAHPDRLMPALTLPWHDVDLSVREMQRFSGLEKKAVQAPSGPAKDISFGATHWDPLWAEHQEQDIPVSLHVGSAGTSASKLLHPEIKHPSWWTFTVESTELMNSFCSFFQGTVFDRFPDLKILILESGCLWMPYFLERMDETFELIGFTTDLKNKPSDYFNERGWISMEPDDELGAATAKLMGADRLVWAFDYPHSDSCEEPVARLRESLSELSPDDQAKVMGLNVRDIYGL